MRVGTAWVLATLCACSAASEPKPEDQVVVTVGGVPISVEEFER